MNAETVSYRYTRAELSALLLLLHLNALPGAPLPPITEADYRKAMDSLADSGLVTPAADRAIIDSLTTLIVSSAARCRYYARFDAPDRTIVIWRCPIMGVLGTFPAQGGCTLTPLGSFEEALSVLGDALARCAFPVSASSPALLGEETLSAADEPQLNSVRASLWHSAQAVEAKDK